MMGNNDLSRLIVVSTVLEDILEELREMPPSDHGAMAAETYNTVGMMISELTKMGGGNDDIDVVRDMGVTLVRAIKKHPPQRVMDNLRALEKAPEENETEHLSRQRKMILAQIDMLYDGYPCEGDAIVANLMLKGIDDISNDDYRYIADSEIDRIMLNEMGVCLEQTGSQDPDHIAWATGLTMRDIDSIAPGDVQGYIDLAKRIIDMGKLNALQHVLREKTEYWHWFATQESGTLIEFKDKHGETIKYHAFYIS